MTGFRTFLSIAREGMRLRTEAPRQPVIRAVRAERRPAGADGGCETVIRYEYRWPDADGHTPAWHHDALVLHEDGDRRCLASGSCGLGLRLRPSPADLAGPALRLVTLPLSLLAPVWLLSRRRWRDIERQTGMTREAYTAYRALAPHLEGRMRGFLRQALQHGCSEHLRP